MTAINTQMPLVPGRLEQMSTRIAFFIAGFGLAAWAPLVPYAKARAGLDEATLGLLLLCLGAGSILAMPIAGVLATRFGCRRVLIGGTLLICLALPLLATASSMPLLVATLFVFGAGLGAVDSTVNLQAVIVERASGRNMMSGFHGLFSVGGIAGAAGVSALLALGLSPLWAIVVVIVLILAALLKAAPHLLPYGSESSGPAFAVPHGVVLFIGLLCFTVFLAEGAMLDWSAVFLTTEKSIGEAYAGLGYAAFALTMTAGRLMGDCIGRRVCCHGHGPGDAGTELGSCTARLRTGRRGLLQHCAGALHRRRQTDRDAGKHRRAGHYYPGVCGDSGRACGHRFYRPCQQPEQCLFADHRHAGSRSHQRADIAGLDAMPSL